MDLFRLKVHRPVWAIAEGKCGQFGVFLFLFLQKKRRKESQSPSAGNFLKSKIIRIILTTVLIFIIDFSIKYFTDILLYKVFPYTLSFQSYWSLKIKQFHYLQFADEVGV